MYELSIRDWCAAMQVQAPKTKKEALDVLVRLRQKRQKAENGIQRAVKERYNIVDFDDSLPEHCAVRAALCDVIGKTRSPHKNGPQGLDAIIFQLPDNRGKKIPVRKRDMYPRSLNDPRWNKPTDGVWEGFRGMKHILESRELDTANGEIDTSRWQDAKESTHENNKRVLIREQTLNLLEQAGYVEVPYKPTEFYELLGKVRKRYQRATDKKERALLTTVIAELEKDEVLARMERPKAAIYRDDRGYELFRLPLH